MIQTQEGTPSCCSTARRRMPATPVQSARTGVVLVAQTSACRAVTHRADVVCPMPTGTTPAVHAAARILPALSASNMATPTLADDDLVAKTPHSITDYGHRTLRGTMSVHVCLLWSDVVLSVNRTRLAAAAMTLPQHPGAKWHRALHLPPQGGGTL